MITHDTLDELCWQRQLHRVLVRYIKLKKKFLYFEYDHVVKLVENFFLQFDLMY